MFTVVLACFKIAEDLVIGKIHGRSFQENISNLGGGIWNGILTLSVLVFIMLIPFFSFTELRRAFGADRLVGVFFRPRYRHQSQICLPLEPDKRPTEQQFTRF